MRWCLAIVTIVALVASACSKNGGDVPPSAAPKPAPVAQATAPPVVKTVQPDYRTRPRILETTGKVQFDEDRVVRVHAPITGRIIEVFAKPGDLVEPGTRLVMLDSPDLGSAKADYAKAVADAVRSEKALQLARELYEVKAIAEKEVRDAENEHAKTLAERERAEARLRTLGVSRSQLPDIAARKDASTTIVLTASATGIVVERNVVPGQVVSYGQSDTPVNLFVIADLRRMWVLADVYEPDVALVHHGQTASVTLPCCPNERYEGRVDYIADVVDKDTRTVKVRVAVPNRGRLLKAEMFVRVTIATGSTRVLAIPQSAVHREEGQTFVLVQHGQQWDRRPVKLGSEFEGLVEVTSGLTPDDRVAAGGSILLKDAAK